MHETYKDMYMMSISWPCGSWRYTSWMYMYFDGYITSIYLYDLCIYTDTSCLTWYIRFSSILKHIWYLHHMYKYIFSYIMHRHDVTGYRYTWNIQGYVHDIMPWPCGSCYFSSSKCICTSESMDIYQVYMACVCTDTPCIYVMR